MSSETNDTMFEYSKYDGNRSEYFGVLFIGSYSMESARGF